MQGSKVAGGNGAGARRRRVMLSRASSSMIKESNVSYEFSVPDTVGTGKKEVEIQKGLLQVQNGILWDQVLNPEKLDLNGSRLVEIPPCEGLTDQQVVQRVAETWLLLSREIDALRGRVVTTDDGFEIVYDAPFEPKVMLLDLADYDINYLGRWVQKFCDKQDNMDWKTADQGTYIVIKYDENRFMMFLRLNHVHMDGFGGQLLLDRFRAAFKDQTFVSRPSFLEIVRDEQQYLQSDQYQQDLTFWTNFFETNEFNTFPSNQNCGRLQVEIPLDILLGFKDFSNKQILVTWLAIIASTVSRTFLFENVLLKTLTHGRRGATQREIIGCAVNTFFVDSGFLTKDGMTVETALQEMGKSLATCFKHSRFPISHLSQHLRPGVQFILDAFPGERQLGSIFERFVDDYLMIRLTKSISNKFVFMISYDRKVIPDINVFVDRLFNVTRTFLKKPETKITNLEIMTQQEFALINQWNATERDFQSQGKTLHGIFEEQAIQFPDRVALVFNKSSLTYSQVNGRANALANTLGKLKPDTLVGLYVNRGFDMIISMLAIMKAGGAYVPISPAYPRERVDFILQDANLNMIVTNEEYHGRFDSTRTTILLVEQVDQTQTSFDSSFVREQNLAYLIYTSGTTGRPKGCMIEHRNAINLVFAQRVAFEAEEVTTALSFASYVFDASVSEIFVSLALGHKLCIASNEERTNADLLGSLIEKEKVELATIPPSLVLSLPLEKVRHSLKKLVLAGEQPSLQAFEIFSSFCHVFNAYGPSECAVCATSHLYSFGDSNSNIGGAIPNAKLFVLDSQQKPVPIGTPGELYIGGVGVGRGYLNRPELTKERFVTLEASDNERVYKTGDLVSWLPNGELEFLGRNDSQVKIRGFRIELGEIESALLNVDTVKQAVVVKRNDRLAAYLVGDSINVSEARRHLEQELPEYMVPSSFTLLETIPLTINGKVDHKALPEPQIATGANYVAPHTELERTLSDLWSVLLDLKQVGVEDNFFRIGGDSIKSIQLVSRLREQQDIVVSPKDIFDCPTIRKLSKFILSKQTKVINAEQGILEGQFPLLPIQEWFYAKQLDCPHHFNQAFSIRVPPYVTFEMVHAALSKLVEHHDILRLRLLPDGQRYEKTVQIQCVEVTEPANESLLTELQGDFDLEKGLMWRCALIKPESRLWFALHHMIVDAVSWRILAEDLSTLVKNACMKDFSLQSKKSSSYRQWVQTLDSFQPNKQYWKNVLEGYAGIPSTSFVSEVPTLQEIEFDAILTEKLIHHANKAFHTEVNDLLLSAFSLALSQHTGVNVTHVSLEGIGRVDGIDDTMDLTRTVGWFTNIFPVKLCSTNDDMEQTIISTKEMLRKIPHKGIGFGVLCKRNDTCSFDQLPKIVFNYLGQFKGGSDFWELLPNANNGRTVLDRDLGNALECNGYIDASGRLKFQLLSRFGDRFPEMFKEALEKVVAFCFSRKNSPTPTPSDYDAPNLSLDEFEKLKAKYGDIEAIFPASHLQQGFIYHALSQPNDDAYRVQLLMSYKSLDVERYMSAWNRAVQRFPALRTCFAWEREMIQVVVKNIPTLEYQIVPGSEMTKALEQDRKTSFDLRKPGLIRFIFAKHADTTTVIFSNHHSILDGWSLPVLMQAVHSYYINEPRLVSTDQKYFDCQKYLAKTASSTGSKFWNDVVLGDANDLNVMLSNSVDLSAPIAVTNPCEKQILIRNPNLKETCSKLGCTLNALVQFAWHFLVQTYTGDKQTIVGATVSGRDIPVDGAETCVGLFINTLPLWLDWDEGKTLQEMVNLVQQRVSELNSNSNVSLASLQKDGARLFHSIVVFENYPGDEKNVDIDMSFDKAVEKLDYPLVLRAFESAQNELILELQGCNKWLDDRQAFKLLTQLELVLNQFCLGTEHKTISLLDEEDLLLLQEWNATEVPFPHDQTLCQLFTKQVEATPNGLALKFGTESMTYKEMNEKVTKLSQGLKADQLIGIYMDRSLEMVLGIFAILMAGSAYVPISPEYPQQRVDFILEDTKMEIILTQSKFHDQLQSKVKTVICADQLQAYQQQQQQQQQPPVISPEDLAYIIYTSGTTGKPKGVMIEHRNVVNRLDWMQNEYRLEGQNDVVLQKTPFVFDVSVWEFLWPLLQGATLVVAPPDAHKDPSKLRQLIIENEVTTIHFVPSMLDSFSTFLSSSNLGVPKCLTRIFCSGEALKPQHAEYVLPDCRIHNLYGPTEAAIDVSYHECLQGEVFYPIGKPVQNTQLYVLNEQMEHCPIGAIGELFIGGIQVARGYLNRPELTKERFVLYGKERVYKTGDLVRQLPSGELQYLGRNDSQVKVRGFRIELGEIESAMLHNENVQQAVVVKRKESLVAYLVGKENVDIESVRQCLEQELPEYMVPSFFMVVESIPTTINGKVNYKALPEPEISNEDTFVAPTNELETKLCEIWQQLLSLDQVGIEDNFFRIGGSSIDAVKLCSLVDTKLGLHLEVGSVFEHRTVAQLAIHLAGKIALGRIPKQDTKVDLPLSYAQQRTLFIEQLEGGSSAYHIPFTISLKNKFTDTERLQKAFRMVINRHLVLNSVLIENDGVMVQHVLEELDSLESISSKKNETLEQFVTRPFNLANERPIRVMFGAEDLYVVIHHIAFDGWSMSIFLAELEQAYHQEEELPELDIQYRDFAVWEREQNVTGLPFWKDQLDGFENLDLPLDKVRPVKADYAGGIVPFEFKAELTEKLKLVAKHTGSSLFTVMLSGFYILLNKLTGQQDIVVGTPSDNRGHPQTQKLIGMFVNSLPLRAQVSNDKTPIQLIQEVDNMFSRCKAHENVPFELMVEHLNIERDTSRHPIFQTCFSLSKSDFGSKSDFECYAPAKFDLSLQIIEGETGLSGGFNFATSLFETKTIERMVSRLTNVFEAIVVADVHPVGDINVVLREEELMMANWNASQKEDFSPELQTLHGLFEIQARKTPNAIALVFNNEELTYQALDRRANGLAASIGKLEPDTLVGLYLDRSLEMVISMLAVMKAGGAYVPISPEYPQERVDFILQDANLQSIVTQTKYATQFKEQRAILVDDGVEENDFQSVQIPSSLAYVIYTSGTTGKPKGTMNVHKGVVNYVLATISRFGYEKMSRGLAFLSYVFDASVNGIFPPLATGLTLFIASEEQRKEPAQLMDLINENEIQVAAFTPSFAAMLGPLPSLKCLFLGGEAPAAEVLNRFKEAGTVVSNVYGPTECSVCATTHFYKPGDSSSNIGKPLANVNLYVLDEMRKQIPIGSVGELYIGGAGVGRGYLNLPDLTNERFVQFKDDRAYKTGDLVRWLPSGELEFLGRNDSQVKVRGFRIELGEIENTMVQISGVSRAVVIKRNERLAAYLVSAAEVNVETVRQYLEQELPEYMVPSSFNVLETIPLTINGKVNYKALPEPEFSNENTFVAPTNELETKLCEIWQQLLSLDQVGIEDNFFRIGGSSIDAVKLCSLVDTKLGLNLEVGAVFEHRTVAKLAIHLKDKEALGRIQKQDTNIDLPLSYAQQRTLFIEQLEGGSSAYHIPFTVSLKDKFTDTERLKEALKTVINRHLVLNSVLIEKNGAMVEHVLEPLTNIDTLTR